MQTLQAQPGEITVNIKAEDDMPSGYVRDLTRRLEEMKLKVKTKFIGVSEKG